MKNIFIIASLLLLCQFSFSQTQKGRWMVGVSVGSGALGHTDSKQKYGSATYYENDNKAFDIAVSPTALYFVCDNLALGATIGLGYSTEKKNETYTTAIQTVATKAHYFPISFDPEIRKYFGKPGSKGQPWINIFGGVNTSPGKGKQEIVYNNVHTTSDANFISHGWNAGGGIGYSHFFNEHFALQYFINFRHTWSKNKTDYKSGTIVGLDTYTNSNDFNFGVGLQIHLSKKS